MDHIIEYIIDYMDSDVEEFKSEWKSGQYKKMTDCPTYPYVKAYCDAIKALNRLDGRFDGYMPKRYIDELREGF